MVLEFNESKLMIKQKFILTFFIYVYINIDFMDYDKENVPPCNNASTSGRCETIITKPNPIQYTLQDLLEDVKYQSHDITTSTPWLISFSCNSFLKFPYLIKNSYKEGKSTEVSKSSQTFHGQQIMQEMKYLALPS